MFKKSQLEDNPVASSVSGRQVFNGFVGVRSVPDNPPPLLKERIGKGQDILSIWFHHVHNQLFSDLEEWRGIICTSEEAREKSLLPAIDEMTPREIFEFCKSIDVHPAHLVPFDIDKSLSLPTPLLELLVEMSRPDIDGCAYDQDDAYLAKAAVAYEGHRICNHLDHQHRSQRESYGDMLAVIFERLLEDSQTVSFMRKAKILSESERFGKNYSYINRLLDMIFVKTEQILYSSHHKLKLQQDICNVRTEGFISTYYKLVHPDRRSRANAIAFLSEVREKYEEQYGPHDVRIKDIERVVSGILQGHSPYLRSFQDSYQAAQDVFTRKLGVRKMSPLKQEDNSLREPEQEYLRELALSIRSVFDGQSNLGLARETYNDYERRYDRTLVEIREAFGSVCGNGYESRLWNNRVLLALHDFSLPKPQPWNRSPR